MSDGLNMQPRIGEPESAMTPGMAAPREPNYGLVLPLSPAPLIPTPGPGPYAEQQPAAWSYDFDPANGSSRASYPGEINFGGVAPGLVTSWNTRSGAVTMTEADVAAAVAAGGAPLPLPGVSDGSNAAAGKIGEYLQLIVASGAGPALVSNVPANVGQLVLSAGDWDVSGTVGFGPTTVTAFSALAAGISVVSGTFPGVSNGGYSSLWAPFNPGAGQVMPISMVRVSVAVATTVYLLATAIFTGGPMVAYGGLYARRAR